MKIAATIAGVLLGLVFVVLPSLIIFGIIHEPPPAPDSPAGMFFNAFASTGWINLLYFTEIVGGILVAIPKTRNFGLLFLGPVIINILAFHLLVVKSGLVGPPLLVAVLAAFLLFVERRKFANLTN